MKNLIFILSALTLFSSCSDRTYTMRVCAGDGIAYTETWVECDSFQMVSNKEAYIWVDSQKMKIFGDRGIKPESN